MYVNANQSMWYTTLTNWKIEIILSSQKCRKNLLTKFKIHLWYDKYSQQSESRGNITQHNKGHICQAHSQYHTQQWKAESISPKVNNKTRMPTSFFEDDMIFYTENPKDDKKKDRKSVV